ncbi:MAG: prfA 2 [Planctomycetota bacterium]|nr:prfA 2 [Planctomycetota bacterium]
MKHPAALASDQLLTECDVRFTRRSGPGGQNRNKVETAAILTHRPTGLSAEANERRSQSQNREVALFRLRLLLAIEVRVQREPGAMPGRLWQSRCVAGRILINPKHDDFPAILAEALDFLDRENGDLRAAGEALGCTMSQLTRFLKQEPRAFAAINRRRQSLGLRPLL